MQRSSRKTITTIFFQSFCVLEARKTLSFKTLACKRQNNSLISLFEILFYYALYLLFTIIYLLLYLLFEIFQLSL